MPLSEPQDQKSAMECDAMTDEVHSTVLPTEWRAVTGADGSTRLRIAGIDRRYPAWFFGTIAAAWTGGIA
jgi:hypothetical protein